MLTFEYTESGTLEIYFDLDGRNLLLNSLRNIQEPGDHDHLFSPAYGSHELSEQVRGGGNQVIHMVTMGIPRNPDPEPASSEAP